MDDDSRLVAARRALADLLHFTHHCVAVKDNYRKRLLKLSAQGRREDLHTALSHSSVEQDMEEVLVYFDRVILDLFPDFVSSCGRLFKGAECQQPLPRGRLSMEQRVLAMMKLGEWEPARIAAVLNLSVGTVYNYRSRLRGKLLAGISITDAVERL